MVTKQFREKNIDYLLIMLGIGIIGLIVLVIMQSEVYRGKAVITVDQGHQSPAIPMERKTFLPAYKIKIRAAIPQNHWLDYEVTLSESDEDIFGFEQNVWKEKGRWREGGESGTWYESDVDNSFTFVPHKTGKYHLNFTVASIKGVNRQPTRKNDRIYLEYSVRKNCASAGVFTAGLIVILLGLMLLLTFTWASKTSVDLKQIKNDKLVEGVNYAFHVNDPGKLVLLHLEIDYNPGFFRDPQIYDGFEIQIMSPDNQKTIIKDAAGPVHKVGDEDTVNRVYSIHKFYYNPSRAGKYPFYIKLNGQAQFYKSRYAATLKIYHVEKTVTSVKVYT